MSQGQRKDRHDVLILGTGMAGTLLAAILAKCGARVLMVDLRPHPRFAVGESTIPHTSLLLSILAAKYGIPEIDHLAYPDRILEHVGSSCGIKRAFGFAYQREGRRFDPREGLHFGTSSKDENHLFRQDTDAYLLHVAIRYGADLRIPAKVVDVDTGAEGVVAHLEDGETIRARYLVDATGHNSVLARVFELREDPPSQRLHSRSTFTHMVGVRPFEEGRSPLALSWHQTTLHHVFEGGWIWVIPFNNQSSSTNPLISVGLTLDPRRYPRGSGPPEREFRRFLSKFPSVAEQFEGARAVRPWVSTGRLQYTSKRCTGERYCLMSHAAGFVDPLYSRGLINTVELIAALVDPLLEALADGDFREERFEHVDALQDRLIDYADKLAAGSYASWADFDLWNAWARVWALGTIITEFRIMTALANYTDSGDPAFIQPELSDQVASDFEDPDYADFFRHATTLMDAFQAGRSSAGRTADALFSLTAGYEFPVQLTLESMRRAGWIGDEERISARSLRFAREGYRWALANPLTRELYGNSDTLYRWRSRRPDPHLLEAESASP